MPPDPAVAAIRAKPHRAMNSPIAWTGRGHSRSRRPANRVVNRACACKVTEPTPGGIPIAMALNSPANWITNRNPAIAINRGHGTAGRAIQRAGTAASAKRSPANKIGGMASSPTRMTTKLKPQIAATRTARRTWATFMVRDAAATGGPRRRGGSRQGRSPPCPRPPGWRG